MTTQNKDSRTTSKHLRDLAPKFGSAMLVTHHASELRSRPMSIAEVLDREIWFSTSVHTGKVDELEKDARALVTMQEPRLYLSLAGTCTLSRDRAHIERLWSESWKLWFPKGKQDPDIVLIGLRIERGEYWDMSGHRGARFLWEATKAYFSGEPAKDLQETHGTL